MSSAAGHLVAVASGPLRRAVTLLELTASLSILSILLVAMGSVVMLAGKAIPRKDHPSVATVLAAQVAGQISAELQVARSISESTATSIEFVVDDRDVPRDSVNETIRYSWSGTPGDPLTRQYNGGGAVPVLPAVQVFSLEYGTINVAQDVTPPGIEGPEELILQQDTETTNGSGAQFGVSNNSRCAQRFGPALPADAVSWRITRCQFTASPGKTKNASLVIEVKPVGGGGKPGGGTIDQVLVPTSSLTNNTWYEVTFAGAGGLDPSKSYFISFASDGGGSAVANIKIDIGVTNTPDSVYYEDDGGGSWSEVETTDIRLWVWGTVTTPDPSWVPPSELKLETVRITVQPVVAVSSRVRLTSRCLNRPDVIAP